jgi:hypothetical protein
MAKVFVLQLEGEIPCTGSTHIIEIAGVAFTKEQLMPILGEKEDELDDYFGDGFEEDGEYCYRNTDYSERPEWVIREHDFLERVQ